MPYRGLILNAISSLDFHLHCLLLDEHDDRKIIKVDPLRGLLNEIKRPQ